MAFYSPQELASLGFRSLGRDVKVSKLASIHNAGAIEIGDYSRIDDFCCLSAGAGGIVIGRRVHVAVYSSLIGAGRIELRNFANLSSRVSVYSSNDDYSGKAMSNPTVPVAYTAVSSASVVVGEHVIIGAGAVILAGVTIQRGAGIGALSLVRSDCEELGMYAGTPARLIGHRASEMFELQTKLDALDQAASAA